jgi:hypothetical protein
MFELELELYRPNITPHLTNDTLILRLSEITAVQLFEGCHRWAQGTNLRSPLPGVVGASGRPQLSPPT